MITLRQDKGSALTHAEMDANFSELDQRLTAVEDIPPGAQGPAGPAGATGATGATGAVGPQGPAGASYVPADTIPVNASRDLSNADAGKTLEVTAAGVTLTVPIGLTLKPGVIIQKHSSGTSLIAGGVTTINDVSTALVITAVMGALVPTAAANKYKLSGV